MANCCSIDLGINFNNPDDAQSFYQWVLRQKAIADEKDTCLVLGESDFVVIDDDVETGSKHGKRAVRSGNNVELMTPRQVSKKEKQVFQPSFS